MPVNERVQEAPVSTLRAMFAGIGRILNFTDKIRNKPATAEAPAEPDATAAAPEGSTLEDTAAPATTAEPDTETPEAAVASPAETGVPDAVTAEATVPGTTAPETTMPEAAAPEAESPAAEAAPAEAKPKARGRARKPTAKPAESEVGGHVKLVPSEESAEEPPAAEPAVAEPAVAGPVAAEAPAAEAPAAETAAAAPAADLPLANYDDLTIASLRARLRNLSVAQLGQLIEYEKSHAGRADVIAMFERRVAKIESEG